MRNAARARENAPPTQSDDWGNELPLPGDLHAMRQGDRDMAEGRLIPDAAIGRMLRRLARKRQLAGGSK